MADKTKVQVYLDAETNEALRAGAEAAGQTLSEYVTRAIKAHSTKPWENLETRGNESVEEAMRRYLHRGDRA